MKKLHQIKEYWVDVLYVIEGLMISDSTLNSIQ